MNDGMNDVDDELKDALRREEPPAGFAERVLSRVGERRQDAQGGPGPFAPGVQAGPKGTALPVHWAAAAAVVVALAGGWLEYRALQRERVEGEAAKARVVMALHIAGSKLQLVQTKINRLHEPPAKSSIGAPQ
jgi:hypothetical protein